MKHITEASYKEIIAVIDMAMDDPELTRIDALRAAFDFTPVEEYDPAVMKVAADGSRSAKPLFPQPAEGVAELTDAEWHAFQNIPEQGYSHRSWVNARIQERVAAALSASQRPTPSDGELRAKLARVEALRQEWLEALDSPSHEVLLENVLDALVAALSTPKGN